MSHNITVTGGKTVRLPTAGKYCDRDIVVTAAGGIEDLDAVLTEQESLIDELKSVLSGKAVGGEAVIESLAVTENGTYTAQNGVDGYSPVTVNVPIPDGYIVPSGTLKVTENGTHDVTEYASVNVNVSAVEDLSSGIDAMITNNVTSIDSDVTTLRDYACYGLGSLLTANLPNATRIGSMAFRACTKLHTVNAPKVTTLGTYAFYTCSKLQKVDFPALAAIPAACFQISALFDTLILRSPTMVTLANTNALTSTKIASGTGYIYVPRALLSDDDASKDYRRASNWSTYAARFRAIEDYPEVCEVKV